MLYDRKWETKTKPDVFSLESLIAWLEKMPAAGSYCFIDTGGCLLHQYLKASGFPVALVAGSFYRILGSSGYHDLSREFSTVAEGKPHTFGAALQRARAARSAL